MWHLFTVFIFLTSIFTICPRNTHEKNFRTLKIPMRKILYQRNTQEKNLGPTKYPREEILYPRNTHQKKLVPTKYSREKILDLRNTHKKNFRHTKVRWHKIDEAHRIQHTLFRLCYFKTITRKLLLMKIFKSFPAFKISSKMILFNILAMLFVMLS